MKKLAGFLIIILNCNFAYSQEPQVKNDFDFVSFTIKDTYPGYRDKVKGNEFDALLRRVKQSRSKDTFALLSRMTTFFKDKHVVLTDPTIGSKKIDTQQCQKDSQMIRQYFAGNKRKAVYEGYWLNEYGHCIMALKKVNDNPVTYYGYVIETTKKAIPGYCILKMVQQKDGTFYTDYVTENLSARIFAHCTFKNKGILWLSSYGRWKHLPKYEPGMLKSTVPFSFKPDFTILDTNTVLLKMPDFNNYDRNFYDSIIKANKAAIDNAVTLIIDIRNNLGGYVNNYMPLLPYIYTNPIVHSGGYTLVGERFLKQHEDAIVQFTKDGDTASANSYIAYRDTFLRKKGQLYYRPGDTLAQNMPILNKPKNVAIIMNHNCVSAAELMLQNFRQSSKVKFFGEHSGGAVDYLNLMSFRLPYHKYGLYIASVKRAVNEREPNYDGKGIPPDVEIGDEVSDWIAFVKKYYDEHQ